MSYGSSACLNGIQHILANMQSSDVLRELQKLSGLNAAGLAQSTGLSESLISRALNGRNDPSFGKIAMAAERLGYQLTLTPLEQATVDICDLRLDALIQTINANAHSADSWSRISAGMRELLESSGNAHPTVSLPSALKRMPDNHWRAFMGGLYQHCRWDDGGIPAKDLRLPEQWTPLRKIYRSATPPDKDFLDYNVYLPQGELQWK